MIKIMSLQDSNSSPFKQSITPFLPANPFIVTSGKYTTKGVWNTKLRLFAFYHLNYLRKALYVIQTIEQRFRVNTHPV